MGFHRLSRQYTGVAGGEFIRPLASIEAQGLLAWLKVVWIFGLYSAIRGEMIQSGAALLYYDCNSGKEIEKACKRQLTVINDDLRQIRLALAILQIMKSLQSSDDHCKNLAEYCIFMIDGQDLHHIEYSPLAN